jgi:transcriptional regulator with XRE-family HTH domain
MAERHLTVDDLHNALGGAVSVRTLWRWRSGAAVPGAEALPLLARALHTTPNELLGWEDA